jgi:hypothetical protein
MENDIKVNYDALCYATFLNIGHLTKEADRIAFINFDTTNKEHLFVLAVTMACWNILGEKEVAIDQNLFRRAKLNKKYKNTCKIAETKKDELHVVDVDELLEFMRGSACQSLGDEFTFGEIYDAYYAEESR